MGEHFKPYEIKDEKWEGEKPTHTGSTWLDENGNEVVSSVYQTWFGGGETIPSNRGELCVHFEAEIPEWNVRVFMFGLRYPTFRILNHKTAVCMFDSATDNPRLFDSRLLKDDVFKTHIGNLFMDRIGEALNFTWEGPNVE